MFSNMNNINYNDFKNICRTCSLNCDVKFFQDAAISDIFYRLTDIRFETNDDLPKQICSKCFQKIIEIQEFSKQCKQAHSKLMECVTNYKNMEIEEEQEINEETNVLSEIEVEVLIEEHKIEFAKNKELSTTINEVVDELDQNINNPYKCDQCAKSFARAEGLKIHMRVHCSKRKHSGERSYICDQCSKKFTRASCLKIHERTHSGERPYTCDQCGKTFTQAEHLKSHKQVHNGERIYNCDQCSKTFMRAADLKRHKRVHSGERPYKCEQCSKMFTQAGHLMIHKFIHSGERPYKCDQCAKTFTQVGHLRIHKRIHSV